MEASLNHNDAPQNGHAHLTTTAAPPRRILLVDDDPAILLSASTALRQAGYSCVKTRSAAMALEQLQTNSFDLMIADVAMPGMSGIDLTKNALELIPDLTVVIMSGASEIENPVNAIRAGATDYLSKPFDIQELHSCVTRTFGKKETEFERKRKQALRIQWDAAARAFALSLDARDHETEGHAERVLAYSLRLGQEIGLSADDLVALELGARLHDIGKIGVPDHILKKPGPLDEDERAIMSLHPGRGEEMVRNMKLPDDAAVIVGQHHEKWDGSGYPRKLRGEEIHIGARVFSVVDTFDAITSDRCYRKGRPYQDALEEILKFSNTQFDPAIVEAFAKIDPAEWDQIRSKCSMEETAAVA